MFSVTLLIRLLVAFGIEEDASRDLSLDRGSDWCVMPSYKVTRRNPQQVTGLFEICWQDFPFHTGNRESICVMPLPCEHKRFTCVEVLSVWSTFQSSSMASPTITDATPHKRHMFNAHFLHQGVNIHTETHREGLEQNLGSGIILVCNSALCSALHLLFSQTKTC